MQSLRVHLTALALLLPFATAAADELQSPRRANGHIGLQGTWAHTNLTPFERPADIATFIITPEQAQQIEGKIVARNEDLSRPAEPALYFDDRRVEPIDGQLRSSIVVDPSNGLLPGNDRFKELVAQARKDLFTAFDGPEQRPGSERCLSAPSAAPPISLVPAGDLRQIVQTENAILIASEELHEARVVRMNAAHGPAAVQSWLGDSIGWWEGHTLVIETKHFAPTSGGRMGPNSLFFISPQATVVERLELIGSDELRYVFTVDDPSYYTRPWRGETRLHRSSKPMLEYACHEGNYSLAYVLQGGRAVEQRSSSEQGK